RPGIGAGSKAVERCGAPDGEGKVVKTPPRRVAQALSVVVRDGEREQQLRSDDAQAGTKRAVARDERDDDRLRGQVRLRVDREPEDVEGDEDSGQQAGEAMDVLDGEPRPALEA